MAADVAVTSWPDGEPVTEGNVRRKMTAEGLSPYQWSNGPHDRYGAHSHSYHKVIYVVRGAITFGLPERGEEVDLVAGDRLDLPAGVTHNAVVGPAGVVCLEGHR